MRARLSPRAGATTRPFAADLEPPRPHRRRPRAPSCRRLRAYLRRAGPRGQLGGDRQHAGRRAGGDPRPWPARSTPPRNRRCWRRQRGGTRPRRCSRCCAWRRTQAGIATKPATRARRHERPTRPPRPTPRQSRSIRGCWRSWSARSPRGRWSMTGPHNELISRKAGLAYPIRDGIPIMLPDEARRLSSTASRRLMPTDIHLDRAEKQLEVDLRRRRATSPCRPNISASKARAPKCRATAPTRSKSSPAAATSASSAIEPVGNYAVRLIFDDLHDTGIYSWDYLLTLGREQASRWQRYLAALAARGLSRDP